MFVNFQIAPPCEFPWLNCYTRFKMAPATDIELINFLDPSLTVIQQNNDHSFDEHCDNTFNFMFTRISACKYFDMNSKLLNNSRNSNSLILLHFNIRSPQTKL